jgi:hypothetical protein
MSGKGTGNFFVNRLQISFNTWVLTTQSKKLRASSEIDAWLNYQIVEKNENICINKSFITAHWLLPC